MSQRRRSTCGKHPGLPAIVLLVLLASGPAALAGGRGEHSPGTVRSRDLGVRAWAVPEHAAPGDTLDLPLFADAEYTAVLERLSTSRSGGRVWSGRLAGHPRSSVLLVARGDVLVGRIAAGDRTFRIRYVGRGIHRIEELDPDRPQALDDGAVRPPGAGATWPRGVTWSVRSLPIPKPTSETATFDLLALYTPAAQRRAGGKKAIRSLIELHVEVANQALTASRARARIRLVAARRVAYREADSMGRDLANLKYRGDGKLDRAADLRDRFGGDFVTLYVDRPRDRLCGNAYLGWSVRALESGADPADSAFSVVRHDCPDRTLAHELGHGMGLLHGREDYDDPHQADTWGATPYAYGFKHRGKDDRFHTLMALRCNGCTPLLRFANPRVRHQGVRTGVGRKKDLSADTVRAINRLRDELAKHRPCRVDCEETP